MPQRPNIQSLSEPGIIAPVRQTSIPFIAPNRPALIKEKGQGIQDGLKSLVDGLNSFFSDEIEERQAKVEANTFNLAQTDAAQEAMDAFAEKFNATPAGDRGDFAEGLFQFLDEKGIHFPNVMQTMRATQFYGRKKGQELGAILEADGRNADFFNYDTGQVIDGAQSEALVSKRKEAILNDPFLANNPLAMQEALLGFEASEARFRDQFTRTRESVEKEFTSQRRHDELLAGDPDTGVGGLQDVFGVTDPARLSAIYDSARETISAINKSGESGAAAAINAITTIAQRAAARGDVDLAVDSANQLLQGLLLPNGGGTVGSVVTGEAGEANLRLSQLLNEIDGTQGERDRANERDFLSAARPHVAEAMRSAEISGSSPIAEIAEIEEIAALQGELSLSDEQFELMLVDLTREWTSKQNTADADADRRMENIWNRAFVDGDTETMELAASQIANPDALKRISARQSSDVPALIKRNASADGVEALMKDFKTRASSETGGSEEQLAEYRALEDELEAMRSGLLEADPTLTAAARNDLVTERYEAFRKTLVARTQAVNDTRSEGIALTNELRVLEDSSASRAEFRNLLKTKGHLLPGTTLTAFRDRDKNYREGRANKQRDLQRSIQNYVDVLASSSFADEDPNLSEALRVSGKARAFSYINSNMSSFMAELSDRGFSNAALTEDQGQLTEEFGQRVSDLFLGGITTDDVDAAPSLIAQRLLKESGAALLAGNKTLGEYSAEVTRTITISAEASGGVPDDIQRLLKHMELGPSASKFSTVSGPVGTRSRRADFLAFTARPRAERASQEAVQAASGSLTFEDLAKGRRVTEAQLKLTGVRAALERLNASDEDIAQFVSELQSKGTAEFGGDLGGSDKLSITAKLLRPGRVAQGTRIPADFIMEVDAFLEEGDVGAYFALSTEDFSQALTPEARKLAREEGFRATSRNAALLNAAATYGTDTLFKKLGVETLKEANDLLPTYRAISTREE